MTGMRIIEQLQAILDGVGVPLVLAFCRNGRMPARDREHPLGAMNPLMVPDEGPTRFLP